MVRSWLCMSLVLALASPMLAGDPGDPGDLAVKDAWVRQPPPGTNAAAYLTLENARSATRSVVGVSCSAAEKAELHRTRVEDGVAKMAPVAVVEIPAGGSVTFAPRGLHIMLIRPTLPAAGEPVELVLELDGGETLSVTAVVRGPGGEAEVDHDHH